MPATIRRATNKDLPAILEIERLSATAAHWTIDQYAHLVATGIVLMAELDNESVGFICTRALTTEWEIENIVVAQQVRRRGIADALLDEFLRLVKSQAGQAVWLEVRESNHPARSLYEKHGFRETGRRPGYYQQPPEDAVLYEWRAAGSGRKATTGSLTGA